MNVERGKEENNEEVFPEEETGSADLLLLNTNQIVLEF